MAGPTKRPIIPLSKTATTQETNLGVENETKAYPPEIVIVRKTVKARKKVFMANAREPFTATQNKSGNLGGGIQPPPASPRHEIPKQHKQPRP